MGFDDLKTIEAKKFLLAVAGGPAENSNVHDALSAAATVTAAEVSAATGQWQKLEPVAGTTASRSTDG
jgi:predicted dehydrogenase